MSLLEEAADRLRNYGHKLTRPRRNILELLYQDEGYATPGEIYAALRKHAAGVGLTSVYRNLELLETVGLVRRVCFHDGCQRYEPVLAEDHHHHLICSECGEVVKFAGCDLGVLEETLEHTTGFIIEHHMLQIFGVCRDCQHKFRQKKDGM